MLASGDIWPSDSSVCLRAQAVPEEQCQRPELGSITQLFWADDMKFDICILRHPKQINIVILLPGVRIWIHSMTVFNNTGNKKSLLLFLFKLQTLICIHFPCLSRSIIKFQTFAIKTFFLRNSHFSLSIVAFNLTHSSQKLLQSFKILVRIGPGFCWSSIRDPMFQDCCGDCLS